TLFRSMDDRSPSMRRSRWSHVSVVLAVVQVGVDGSVVETAATAINRVHVLPEPEGVLWLSISSGSRFSDWFRIALTSKSATLLLPMCDGLHSLARHPRS